VLNNVKTEHFNWLLLITILLLLVEISLSSGGFIFFLFISSFCIYIGHKRMKKDLGKFWFWFGIVILILTIINMSTFKLLLIALLIYILIEFRKSKKSPNHIQPELIPGELAIEGEPILKRENLFENYLFGLQKTPDHVYEWNDINIVSGIGDTIIDLSNTVLPQGESVIVIRHFIGKVQIMIPYEVEVSILHSAIAGRAIIFHHEEKKPFNQTLSFHTPDYEFAQQKIKIVTSIISGDLEVKRI
jgi:lia operon protein LiaF